MKKNVLSVIYFFPPMGGSGVQRTLKFIKYMPDFDYFPVVETVEEGHNFAYDESLLDEVPSTVKVYRSNAGETLWLRNIIEKLSSLRKRKNTEDNSDEKDSSSNDSSPSSPGLKDRVFRFIDSNFFIPDSKIRWYKNAVKDVDKVIGNENIDFVFSSSYPYTVHLIALYAKKKYNLPWVADFRDPWVGNVFMTEGHSEKRKKKEAAMEAEVIKYADKIIMVTEPICDMYKKRYPEYSDKFVTITNGFDSGDYTNINTVREDEFTICYSGILTEGQSPETLIKAIEKLIEYDNEVKENIKIKFIGYMLDEYKYMFLNSSLKEKLFVLDYMPHKDCLEHMKGADINLMILADKEESKGVFSGKIFDYIGVEKPILGIMPKGVASNLILQKDIGKSFNHGEVDEVYEFIKDNYYLWKENKGVSTNAKEKCAEFDRINLTKQLVNLFDDLKSN